MADFLLRLTLSLLAAFSLTFPATGKAPTFLKSVKPSPIKLGNEKFSHFQFYWHDIQSGSNPTSVNIVQSPANNFSTPSPTGFGSVNMIDDPLTERPDLGSTLLGRAQGFYGLASQEEIGLLMAMSFMFTTGKYNGSTLTVVGRNPVSESVREMPVIGGSGLFRFARGYVQATTMAFNTITRDAVVEYNVYVLHY